MGSRRLELAKKPEKMNPEKYTAAAWRPENNPHAPLDERFYVQTRGRVWRNPQFIPIIGESTEINIPIKQPYTTLEKILITWTIITHLALAIALIAHYMN